MINQLYIFVFRLLPIERLVLATYTILQLVIWSAIAAVYATILYFRTSFMGYAESWLEICKLAIMAPKVSASIIVGSGRRLYVINIIKIMCVARGTWKWCEIDRGLKNCYYLRQCTYCFYFPTIMRCINYISALNDLLLKYVYILFYYVTHICAIFNILQFRCFWSCTLNLSVEAFYSLTHVDYACVS